MDLRRRVLFLRLSVYAYFALFIVALVFARSWIPAGFFSGAAFFGLVLLVVTRIISYVLIFGAARSQKLRGETSTGRLGEISGYDRPANETRVRDALRAVAETKGGCAPELLAAVEDWLAYAPGTEKDRKRDELLQRLYAQAGAQANTREQGQALNQLRLAINPWVQD